MIQSPHEVTIELRSGCASMNISSYTKNASDCNKIKQLQNHSSAKATECTCTLKFKNRVFENIKAFMPVFTTKDHEKYDISGIDFTSLKMYRLIVKSRLMSESEIGIYNDLEPIEYVPLMKPNPMFVCLSGVKIQGLAPSKHCVLLSFVYLIRNHPSLRKKVGSDFLLDIQNFARIGVQQAEDELVSFKLAENQLKLDNAISKTISTMLMYIVQSSRMNFTVVNGKINLQQLRNKLNNHEEMMFFFRDNSMAMICYDGIHSFNVIPCEADRYMIRDYGFIYKVTSEHIYTQTKWFLSLKFDVNIIQLYENKMYVYHLVSS